MDELLVKTLLKERIKIEPKYLTKSFKDEILNRLKQKVEGICSKHGYIRKNTIELYKVVPGMIEIASLNGNIVYDVYFYGEVCNPLIGSIIKSVKVVNLNRFGILAEVRVSGENSILEIIVAKNSVNIISEIDLDKIQIGDDINIEVIGKRFNIGDRKISVIGKIIKDVKKEPRYKNINIPKIIDEDEDDANLDVGDIEGIDGIEDEENDEDEDEDIENKSENENEDEDNEDEDNDIDDIEDNENDKEETIDDKIGGSDFFSDHDDEYDIMLGEEQENINSDVESDNESI